MDKGNQCKHRPNRKQLAASDVTGFTVSQYLSRCMLPRLLILTQSLILASQSCELDLFTNEFDAFSHVFHG